MASVPPCSSFEKGFTSYCEVNHEPPQQLLREWSISGPEWLFSHRQRDMEIRGSTCQGTIISDLEEAPEAARGAPTYRHLGADLVVQPEQVGAGEEGRHLAD